MKTWRTIFLLAVICFTSPFLCAPSCWDVLGLSPSASISEISSAYRKLTVKYHPDKGGSEEAFCTLHASYQEAINYATRKADKPAPLESRSEPAKEFVYFDLTIADFYNANNFEFKDGDNVIAIPHAPMLLNGSPKWMYFDGTIVCMRLASRLAMNDLGLEELFWSHKDPKDLIFIPKAPARSGNLLTMKLPKALNGEKIEIDVEKALKVECPSSTVENPVCFKIPGKGLLLHYLSSAKDIRGDMIVIVDESSVKKGSNVFSWLYTK